MQKNKAEEEGMNKPSEPDVSQHPLVREILQNSSDIIPTPESVTTLYLAITRNSPESLSVSVNPLEDFPEAQPRGPIPLMKKQPVVDLNINALSQDKGGLNIPTYGGFSPDEAKSALQKSCRRGWKRLINGQDPSIKEVRYEAIQWALELFWGNLHQRTNVWNRILVISLEDIGVADPLVVIKIYYLFLHYRNEAVAICQACQLLVEAKKSRVNDWAVHSYGRKLTPEMSDQIIQRYGGLDFLSVQDSNKVNVALRLVQMELRRSILEKQIGQIIYFCLIFSHTSYKLKGCRYNSAQWLIWETFQTIDPANQYVLTLCRLAMEDNWRWGGESALVWTHLGHYFCSNLVEQFREGFQPIELDRNRWLPEIWRLRQHLNLIGVPQCALDKHTRKGKSLNRHMRFFVLVGAQLNDVDMKWEGLSNLYLWRSGLCHLE